MPQCRSAPMVALGAASDDASADGNGDGETVYEHARVVLRVYDIGGKYTPMMSALLMKEMPAIWHVGIGVFGREYWFSTRIESKALSETETAFGMAPERTHDLGRAVVDVEAFERHIEEVLQEAYNMDTYQGACVYGGMCVCVCVLLVRLTPVDSPTRPSLPPFPLFSQCSRTTATTSPPPPCGS